MVCKNSLQVDGCKRGVFFNSQLAAHFSRIFSYFSAFYALTAPMLSSNFMECKRTPTEIMYPFLWYQKIPLPLVSELHVNANKRGQILLFSLRLRGHHRAAINPIISTLRPFPRGRSEARYYSYGISNELEENGGLESLSRMSYLVVQLKPTMYQIMIRECTLYAVSTNVCYSLDEATRSRQVVPGITLLGELRFGSFLRGSRWGILICWRR